jgi:hypothetical protein
VRYASDQASSFPKVAPETVDTVEALSKPLTLLAWIFCTMSIVAW